MSEPVSSFISSLNSSPVKKAGLEPKKRSERSIQAKFLHRVSTSFIRDYLCEPEGIKEFKFSNGFITQMQQREPYAELVAELNKISMRLHESSWVLSCFSPGVVTYSI